MGYLSELLVEVREKRGAAVMAVINTTPDSFFDGGRYVDSDGARRRIDEVLSEGADIIDIGAESTRPGAPEVPASEQIERALPAVKYAVTRGACVSIDTTLPEVARVMVKEGARIVNDVSCGANPELMDVARDADVDMIIMHSRGSMTKMGGFSHYDETAYQNVVEDVRDEWGAAHSRAIARGLSAERIFFDPGLGFHKNAAHSSELMQRLDEFEAVGAGLVLGASRKSFIGALDGSGPEARLGGSIAACLLGVQKGASILRVHDVQPTTQALLALRHWSKGGAPKARHAHA